MNLPPPRPDVDFAKPAPDCLRAAQDYLKRGWSALPLCPADHAGVDAEHQRICATPGETPLWPWRAYQERLPSERVLSIYWNRNPRANIGIALGPVSGLLAVMFEGPDGEATRRRLVETLPQTLELAGPDGTRRLLYALPAGTALPGGSIRIADSEDMAVCLSAGSCIPLPPSQHRGGGAYAWLPGCAPCEREAAPVPPWLAECLLSQDNSATFKPAVPEQGKSAAEAISSPAYPDARLNAPEKRKPAEERSLQTANPGPVPHVIFLNRVQPCPATWLWPGWIPLGKLTVLDGDPGLGKSTLLLDLAARVTRGVPMPDGGQGPRGGVTLLTAEDSLADTVRPRLEAAGADLDRVRAFSAVGEADGGNRPPVIPRDLEMLRRILTETDSRLLIVDPFLAFLGGGIDSCNDQDIRRCLHRLAELAEATRCAVVLLRHLNKLSGGKALYRGAGSIGIVGAARAGLLVARDPEADQQRVLACTKSNLTQAPVSLRFALAPGAQGVCRVNWLGPSTFLADELINQAEPLEERVVINDVAHFLRTLLASGPVSAVECLRQARAAGISEKTLRRAKTRLRIESVREGEGLLGHWLWVLPPRKPER